MLGEWTISLQNANRLDSVFGISKVDKKPEVFGSQFPNTHKEIKKQTKKNH